MPKERIERLLEEAQAAISEVSGSFDDIEKLIRVVKSLDGFMDTVRSYDTDFDLRLREIERKVEGFRREIDGIYDIAQGNRERIKKLQGDD